MILLRHRSTALAATLLAGACLGAIPAQAGLVFTQKATSSERDAGMNSTQRISIDTEGAKIEFLDSGNPMMPAGSYLLMRRDDDNMLLVNPEAKTWAVFDLSAMMNAMKPMMEGMNPGGPQGEPTGIPKAEKPIVEKLLEEDGGTILGRPTKHYRYRTRLSIVLSMGMGMAMTTETDSTEDVWMAAMPLDARVMRSLEGMSSSIAVPEELRELVETQKAMPQGLPMKQVVVSTSKTTGSGMMAMMAKKMNQEGGKPSTMTTEIVEVAEQDVPASVFQIPAGYTETELMTPGMAMPDMNRRQ